MNKENITPKENKLNILKTILMIAVPLVVGILGGSIVTTTLSIKDPETEKEVIIETKIEPGTSIILAEEQVPAVIETDEGEVEVNLPTVEAVDSANVTSLIECPEGEEECGLGAYIYAPTETPEAFAEYTLGGCYDTDNAFNEQCWDYGDLFWQNYAGRRLSTCGTGSAKGSWEGDCKFTNAGDEFELVFDSGDLQYGDWVVFNNGTWGHIGFAVGKPRNGYIALQAQNQGGGLCPGSTMGGKVNVINISLAHFAGAFRPKTYVQPPEPEPELPETSHGF